MANSLLLTLFLIFSVISAVNSKIPSTNTTINSTIIPKIPSTTPHELDTLLRALRYNGFPLFSNAIATSDIQFQILTSHVTIFAPRDHFLYTLDMATDADAYVAALKSHVIPSRHLTIADLSNVTSPYLETLLPHYSILIGKSESDEGFVVSVDGVRVSDPDLYVGSRFVVHGLDGILLTGFNMYEDTIGEMGKGFFAHEKVKNGGFARVVRKQRKLQYRRVWKSNYSVKRSNYGGVSGEDDF
ncbi:fasciclin-like arabinogalactan protein 19 [Lycium ferocissimum]|uniref:fasciclin-like arabinogalactan protein 19 n=1 Tax=Lycium ferocissimum TaxID=112874 RepID=UPI00281614D8|nr:fasciclin-like arabinogalactan protein 19 [Lycium ferocissimum]